MILNENLLRSDIRFGFELEAFMDDPEMPKHFVRQRLMDKIFYPLFHGGMIVDDETIQADGFTFEYNSPVLHFTPANVKKLGTLLQELKDYGIETNDSCGFHVHFSFPDMSFYDTAWIVTQIALDKDALKLYSYMNDIEFHNFGHADIYAFQRLFQEARILAKDELQMELVRFLTYEKNRVVRLHPQGTLEWRGPRNFLHSVDLIKNFMNKLFQVVDWNRKALAKEIISIGKVKISRKEFDKLLMTNSSLSHETHVMKYLEALKHNPRLVNSDRLWEVDIRYAVLGLSSKYRIDIDEVSAYAQTENAQEKLFDYAKQIKDEHGMLMKFPVLNDDFVNQNIPDITKILLNHKEDIDFIMDKLSDDGLDFILRSSPEVGLYYNGLSDEEQILYYSNKKFPWKPGYASWTKDFFNKGDFE